MMERKIPYSMVERRSLRDFSSLVFAGGLAFLLLVAVGCSGSSAGSTGGRMTLNLLRKDSHLKIWLDGEQALVRR